MNETELEARRFLNMRGVVHEVMRNYNAELIGIHGRQELWLIKLPNEPEPRMLNVLYLLWVGTVQVSEVLTEADARFGALLGELKRVVRKFGPGG